MAKYRQLYTEFWSDSFVLELSSEEKFFYLYLLTNTKTTQSGIYEISRRFIETETGLNRETVEKLINKFCEYNKILYCENTKEIMVLNWMRYNFPNNCNSLKCIQNELQKIKNREFLKILYKKYQAAQLDVENIFKNLLTEESFNNTSADCCIEKVDKLSLNYSLESNSNIICVKVENTEIQNNHDSVKTEEIHEPCERLIHKPFNRGLQGAYKPLVSNRIRSNKQEVINKKQELRNKEEAITKEAAKVIKHENNSSTDCEGLKTIFKIFEENVHAITPLVYEKILSFTTQVSSKVIIMAIHEAVNYNAKTIKYITQILNSWISKGINTVEQVIAYQNQWSNKKTKDQIYNMRSGGFCDYEQRSYDFDALEKQLLGIA